MNDLLPPNSSPLERALALAVARVSAVPTPARALWNPLTCPLALLPWLAWTLRVETWNPDWPEHTKRSVVAVAIDTARHKGTVAAVKGAIHALGAQVELVEWWQTIPAGPAHTFAVNLVANDARTNQVTYSENYAMWAIQRLTLSDDGSGPCQKVTKLSETASSGQHRISSSAPAQPNRPYTFSCYAKAGERRYCGLWIHPSGGGGPYRAHFDLVQGLMVDISPQTTAAIEPVEGYPEWYRLQITREVSTEDTVGCFLKTLDESVLHSNASHTGIEGYGIYATGMQLEQGSTATAYIRTEDEPVTRTDIQDAIPGEINRTKPLRSHYSINFGAAAEGSVNLVGVLQGVAFARLDGKSTF